MEMKCSAIIPMVFVVGLVSCIAAKNIPSNRRRSLGDFPRTTSFPEFDNDTESFKQKCFQNGGASAFQTALTARKNVELCLRTYLNGSTINSDLEKANAAGEIWKVYKKYCRSFSAIKRCLEDHDADVAPCLNKREQYEIKMVQNMTLAAFDFVCANSASYIIRFDKAGGFECANSNRGALTNCVMQYNKEATMIDRRVTIMMWLRMTKPEDCTIFSKLQECIVSKLRVCEDQTISIIADYFYNSIREVTPCQNQLRPQAPEAIDG